MEPNLPAVEGPLERLVMPLALADVVAAICAVGDEAARRGEMFPQTGDEQREDKLAVRRVLEMLRWYEKRCASIKGWPVQHDSAVSVKRNEWTALSPEAQAKLLAMTGDPGPEYRRQQALGAERARKVHLG